MPTRLILIAHAETDATRKGTFPAGEGLNARGKAAASLLGATLPTGARALTSPAPAAHETAWALGLAAEEETALTDLDVGSWAGRSVMEIGMQDAEGATAWLEDPRFDGHGGESFEALIKRAARWLDGLTATRGLTIGVTHAAVLRAMAIAALGADASAFWRIEAPPLTQLALGSDGRRWVLRELRPAS